MFRADVTCGVCVIIYYILYYYTLLLLYYILLYYILYYYYYIIYYYIIYYTYIILYYLILYSSLLLFYSPLPIFSYSSIFFPSSVLLSYPLNVPFKPLHPLPSSLPSHSRNTCRHFNILILYYTLLSSFPFLISSSSI